MFELIISIFWFLIKALAVLTAVSFIIYLIINLPSEIMKQYEDNEGNKKA